jgi:replicative DNA helicase
LRNEDKLVEVESQNICPEHFSVLGHKYIFMAMNYLYSKNVKPSPMAIMEMLTSKQAKDEVEKLGGLEYLTLLEESYVSEDNLSIFSQKILQAYTRKNLYNISKDIIDFVISDDSEVMNPMELVGFAESKINDLVLNTNSKDEVYKMGDETDAVLDERANSPEQIPGLEVGWELYDTYTNGAQPGDLVVLVAESKTGKSVTLTNWATKLAIVDRIPVLYIDTEMNHREQEDRILANLSGIPHTEIVSGTYVLDTVNGDKDDKIERLKRAKQMLKAGAYYHVYMPHFTSEKVSSLVKKYQMQHGIQAVFFDYIKVPSSSAGGSRYMQEFQQLGFFASSLKDIAGTLGIPVFSAAQANRDELGNTNKDAKSIGGSYRILQLASKLMFLTNKSDEQIAKEGFNNGNQVLSIKYQRNGQSDCPPININFNKNILRQTEV